MELQSYTQNLWSRIVPVWRISRDKTGEEHEKKDVHGQTQIRIQIKEGEAQGLDTDTVVWQEPGMAAL